MSDGYCNYLNPGHIKGFEAIVVMLLFGFLGGQGP